MAEIHFSPLAQADLKEIRGYIELELCNPSAARNTVAKILKAIRLLEQFPFSGSPLRAGGFDTGYRSVVSGNYRVFYRCNEVYYPRFIWTQRFYAHPVRGNAVG